MIDAECVKPAPWPSAILHVDIATIDTKSSPAYSTFVASDATSTSPPKN